MAREMLLNFKLVFVVLLLSVSPLLQANIQASSLEIEQIRQKYTELEELAAYADKATFYAALNDIKDYPLVPYAESTFLIKRMSLSYQKQITELLSEFPDAPFSAKLRKKWLHYLADKQLRQAFLEQYVDIGDTDLTCTYLTWRLQNGANKAEVLDKVAEIWVTPYSQPKSCNYLFNLWSKAGLRTQKHVLTRIELAAKKKNYGLLPYLKTLLDDQEKYLAGLWKFAASRPANIAKNGFFLKFDDNEKRIFLYALSRLTFALPEKVEQLWADLADKFSIRPVEQQRVLKRLAIAYAVSNHEESLDWLLRVPEDVVDESVRQWRLAYSLQNNDWQDVYQVLNTLPEQMQANEAVLYWKARSLEALGEKQWSQSAFGELSERRDYYGFLAANKLGTDVNLRHVPIEITDREFFQVGRSKVVQRAYELFKLNRFLDARKEWNVLATEFTDREKLAVAKLAHSWGWYDRPIFTLAEVGYLNDIQLRFPLAYKTLVAENSERKSLDPAFVFAIARRESSFMADAFSSAGAAGLMQIKPSTASYMAKSNIKKSRLFQPELNVKLATNYLSYLIEKTKGNPVLATAAYNAGFSRVKAWLPEHDMQADAWIETIPYKETRNYVKAVMAYTEVYQQLLEREGNAFKGAQTQIISPSLLN
jgi:soluble lytic murein transglycosylase